MKRFRKDPAFSEYRQLRATGIEKIRLGEYPEALEAFEQALGLARGSGESDLPHEAQANIAMAYLQLGEDRKAEAGLREILLNSQVPKTRFGAAYNLAISLRKQGSYDRARSYARHAMENAARLRDASARAACHNLLGNILMNQSHLDDALMEYRKSLAIRRRQKSDVRYSIAILLENMGYTYLLQKRLRRGEALIRRALSIATSVGAKRSIAECHQDLCYAHMLMRHYAEAASLGKAALAIAVEGGFRDIEKNCYYLLGETAHLTGSPEERDRYFDQLQSFYPEIPFLRDFLCAFDLSTILTLKR